MFLLAKYLLISTCLIAVASWGSNYTLGVRRMREFNSISHSLSARELLDNHMQFWREGNENLLKLTMHPSRRCGIWALDVKHLEILSVIEKGYDEIARAYMRDQDFFEATTFIVIYDISFRRERWHSNGIHEVFSCSCQRI
jgi:hypothetical protein